MLFGCLISLIVYAAIFVAYAFFLQATLDPPVLYVVSGIAAFLTAAALGALRNAWLTGNDAAIVGNADWSIMPRDGQRCAMAGSLEPQSTPLEAPISGRPCVIYEYEISSISSIETSDNRTEAKAGADFTGVGMAACVIRGDSRTVELHGYPLLDTIDNDIFSDVNSFRRVRRYLLATPWKDCSGLSVLSGGKDMLSTLLSGEREVRRDWRMIAESNCSWLNPANLHDDGQPIPIASLHDASQAVNDDLDDEDDDDDLEEDDADSHDPAAPVNDYHPSLYEKRIEPGERLVIVGNFDSTRYALVGSTGGLKIYRGEHQQIASRLRQERNQMYIGGFVALIVIQVLLAAGLFVYRHSTETQSKWRKAFIEAIDAHDLAAIDKWLNRGLDVNAPDSQNRTPLFQAEDPAVAKLLLTRGANVNALDKNGDSPLIHAVREGRLAVVRVLLESGANINYKSPQYGLTPLMVAVDHRQPEIIQLLREKGAIDDVVTAETGTAIDENSPPYAICVAYIAAIHARQPDKLQELWNRDSKHDFHTVDWELWHNTRPLEPKLVSAFTRDEHATITITGPTTRGYDVQWTYQLKKDEDKWYIVRERTFP